MKLTFRNVRVSLGGKPILRGVDLCARHGEMTGIIGPNGCGKSTLIKTLFGIVPTTSGAILLEDTPTSALSRKEIARRVGYVGQDIPCAFDFSARDVASMALYARRGLTRLQREAVVEDALHALDLDEYADRSILTLSGGERKRVFIARALAQGVDTLILDEPTNHLDIRHQLFILELLKRSGKTVLIVLHDLRLAAHYCDRLYLMKGGQSLADGAPSEVLTRANIQSAFGIAGYGCTDPEEGLDFRICFSEAGEKYNT